MKTYVRRRVGELLDDGLTMHEGWWQRLVSTRNVHRSPCSVTSVEPIGVHKIAYQTLAL